MSVVAPSCDVLQVNRLQDRTGEATLCLLNMELAKIAQTRHTAAVTLNRLIEGYGVLSDRCSIWPVKAGTGLLTQDSVNRGEADLLNRLRVRSLILTARV